MLARVPQGKVIWISLKNPTSEEVSRIMKEFDLSPSLTTDLMAPNPKNYACHIDGAIKIVLDFPVMKRSDRPHAYEVKFIITKNAFITVHYEDMEGIERFKRQIEVAQTVRKGQKKHTPIDLFITLMNHLYADTEAKIDHLETTLSEIEGSIFDDNEKELVFQISNASRKLIAFRHTLDAQRDVMEDARPLIAEMYKRYDTEMENLATHYTVLTNHAETLSQTLNALRDTNTAMLFTKQNEVVKLFTIMAFVTFPLSLLSSMFGMNVSSAPILGNEGDFWIILAIMLFATVCFFLYFKYKKWI